MTTPDKDGWIRHNGRPCRAGMREASEHCRMSNTEGCNAAAILAAAGEADNE